MIHKINFRYIISYFVLFYSILLGIQISTGIFDSIVSLSDKNVILLLFSYVFFWPIDFLALLIGWVLPSYDGQILLQIGLAKRLNGVFMGPDIEVTVLGSILHLFIIVLFVFFINYLVIRLITKISTIDHWKFCWIFYFYKTISSRGTVYFIY